jgi:hypothetical protein
MELIFVCALVAVVILFYFYSKSPSYQKVLLYFLVLCTVVNVPLSLISFAGPAGNVASKIAILFAFTVSLFNLLLVFKELFSRQWKKTFILFGLLVINGLIFFLDLFVVSASYL